jgi:hypothetical protein
MGLQEDFLPGIVGLLPVIFVDQRLQYRVIGARSLGAKSLRPGRKGT